MTTNAVSDRVSRLVSTELGVRARVRVSNRVRVRVTIGGECRTSGRPHDTVRLLTLRPNANHNS